MIAGYHGWQVHTLEAGLVIAASLGIEPARFTFLLAQEKSSGGSVKKIAALFGVISLALVAYLSLWPVPVEPMVWSASVAPVYVGPHVVNTKLANLNHDLAWQRRGPEHIAIGRDGKLYTAVVSGGILRMNPDGTAQEVFVNTGGRVLGFDFDAAGNLIAADAMKGFAVGRA